MPVLFLAAGQSAKAQVSLEVMGGSAYNFPTPLTIHQFGFRDIRVSANYDTKPFGPYAPYYAWRLSRWRGSQAWEVEHVHHRLFLSNTTPEIQEFTAHYGYNYFLLGHAWKKGELIFHLGAGVVATNPENTVHGLKYRAKPAGSFDGGYGVSGVGAQAAASRKWYFAKHVFFVLDAALIGGWARVPVVNGSANVPNIGLHAHLGTGVSF